MKLVRPAIHPSPYPSANWRASPRCAMHPRLPNLLGPEPCVQVAVGVGTVVLQNQPSGAVFAGTGDAPARHDGEGLHVSFTFARRIWPRSAVSRMLHALLFPGRTCLARRQLANDHGESPRDSLIANPRQQYIVSVTEYVA